NGRACAIRAARCCKRAVMEPCALSLRDNGETRNARPAVAAHAFRHAEHGAKGRRAGNTRIRKSDARSSAAKDSPAGRGFAMRDTAGGGHVIKRWVMGRSYEGRSGRRRVAYSTA